MARWIGLEFDAQQLRVAIGRSRRDGVSVEHLFAIDAATLGDDPQSWGAALSSRLAEAGGTRADCTAVVTRNDVELRRMTLPPVPDEELPDIVRMQAFSEFSSINEQWLLDYIPFPWGANEPQRAVLAVGLRPGAIERWQQLESAAGLKAQKMVFGPVATARWIYGAQLGGELVERQLILQPHRDSWSLIVADAGLPVLVRWVREGEHQSVGDLLTAEIRRTRGAAYSQLDGFELQEVVLLGDRSADALVGQIQLEEPLKMRRVDPLQGLGSPTLDAQVSTGDFAALLATLREQQLTARGPSVAPALDFLNPHKRPEVPDRRRLYSLLAITAVTLVVAGLAAIWYQLGQLDVQIATAKAQERTAALKLVDLKGTDKQLAEWKKWEAEHVQWLAEMARLSAALPSADVVKIRSVLGTVSNVGGGRLTVEGLAAQPNAIVGLDTALSDALHRVEAKTAQKNEADDKYQWKFDQAVEVLPPESLTQGVPATTAPAARNSAGGNSAGRPGRPSASRAAGDGNTSSRPGSGAAAVEDGEL